MKAIDDHHSRGLSHPSDQYELHVVREVIEFRETECVADTDVVQERRSPLGKTFPDMLHSRDCNDDWLASKQNIQFHNGWNQGHHDDFESSSESLLPTRHTPEPVDMSIIFSIEIKPASSTPQRHSWLEAECRAHHGTAPRAIQSQEQIYLVCRASTTSSPVLTMTTIDTTPLASS